MAKLHHLALGAKNVESLATFYAEVFELETVQVHRTEDGEVRSIWLDLGGALLMIERTATSRFTVQGVGAGLFLLAFQVAESERGEFEHRLLEQGCGVESRTQYSSYARDPEGNRLAVSHYPISKSPEKYRSPPPEK